MAGWRPARSPVAAPRIEAGRGIHGSSAGVQVRAAEMAMMTSTPRSVMRSVPTMCHNAASR